MIIVRPIKHRDLDALVALIGNTTFGLTSLPQDRDHLSQRINDSLHGFDKLDTTPRGESYLLVMEDTDAGRMVGVSGMVSKIGGFEPFYAYKIEKSVHHSDQLDVHKEIDTLHLVTEHNGPCEIGSLFLSPDYRRSGLGRLLSLSRFLFMADYPQHFDPQVIAEMRGVIDQHGRSAFWDALGKHFFDIPFPDADYLSIVNKRFIGDLMPTHPIYVPLLPQAAQAVIGKVHPRTDPALKLLYNEGFAFSGMVDIFEAGPIVSCPCDQIRSIKMSISAAVADITTVPLDSPVYLVSNSQRDFRCCQAKFKILSGDHVIIASEIAAALRVAVGDRIRYMTLRGE